MQDSIQLESYAGRPYFLAIRGESDLEDPDDFGVTVYYKDAEKRQKVPVARIDTDHGHVHLDKLFLERQGKEKLDVSLWEAVDFLIDHHPEYARKHRERTEQ